MSENQFKRIAKALFNKWGFMLEDIPRSSSKTPDFYVQDSRHRYIIELKIKGDDFNEIKQQKKILFQGGMVEQSIPTSPRNTLSAIIRKAVKQISDYDPQHNSFHLLWLHSEGQNPDLLRRRFYSTLFGSQDLISTKAAYVICCLYFNESSFYAFREQLDGAFITFFEKGNLGSQFCLNSMSPYAIEFRKSEFYDKVNDCGLHDPELLSKNNSYMIADCEIDRKNKNEIIRFLCNKYGFDHLQTIDMKMHSCMMGMPITKAKKV